MFRGNQILVSVGPPYYDVTGNGLVTPLDASAALNYYNGQPSYYNDYQSWNWQNPADRFDVNWTYPALSKTLRRLRIIVFRVSARRTSSRHCDQ
jgi:hypothetical protein